jgi:hypothetical protein
MGLRVKVLLIGSCVVLPMWGCNSKPAQSTVKGAVTLDGQPLENGLIDFVSIDASVPTAQSTISAGKYEVLVPPGEKRIEIRAPKVTGKKKMYDTPDSPTVDVVTELLPKRYNVDSTLTMTVSEGEQEKSFELTGK